MFRFLDPRGRANFGEFLTVSLICLIVATPLLAVVENSPTPELMLMSLAGLWAIMIVMRVAGIRRVHDGDESPAFVFWVVMLGPTLVLTSTPARTCDFGPPRSP